MYHASTVRMTGDGFTWCKGHCSTWTEPSVCACVQDVLRHEDLSRQGKMWGGVSASEAAHGTLVRGRSRPLVANPLTIYRLCLCTVYSSVCHVALRPTTWTHSFTHAFTHTYALHTHHIHTEREREERKRERERGRETEKDTQTRWHGKRVPSCKA